MTITCTIRNKIPSVPYKTALVADNRHQYTIKFDFDDEWESFGTKTARVVINGTASEIDFTGDAIELPLLPSDCGSIELGVYAGDLSTTAPVRIPVRGSILQSGANPYTPPSMNTLPAATVVALNDLLQMTDVSEGRIVKATIQQITEAISGGMKGIYWAEYGETTFEELRTAIEADLLPALRISSEVYLAAFTNLISIDFCSIPRPGSLTLVKYSISARDAWTCTEVDIAEADKNTIFPVTYNTTTHAQILTAKTGGRLPIMHYDGMTYVLVTCDASAASFASIADDLSLINLVKVTSANAWDDLSFELDDIVKVTVQTFSAAQKAQARKNIEAAKAADAAGNAYRAASIPMGACDSTSTSTAFTASVDGITELRDGVCMWLRNGAVTSAAGFTINVNNLGAKPVYGSIADATASTTAFDKKYTVLFIYNSTRVQGGCWDYVYGFDSNTTYSPVKLGFGYGTCSTAAATAAKTASISSYALTAGGIVSIKFDNDVPASATLNISSKGAKAIYYKGAAITAGVIKAGDTATFVYSTNYHLIAIDRQDAIPALSDDTPQNLGTAAPGTSNEAARADHIHAKPTYTADDVGAEPEIEIITVTDDGAVTQALDAGKFYKFTGALTSLTITLNPTTRAYAQYHFTFVSGATAVTLSIPGTIRMPDGFSVEANKTYEMDFLDGLGLCACWTDTSS